MKPIKSEYCKAFWRFLFSHIGLCLLVFAYCVLGALIFLHFELPLEIEDAKKANSTKCRVEQEKQDMIDRIQTAFANGTLKKGAIKKWLNAYHILLTSNESREAYGISSHTCNAEPKYKWSWPSAVLFTVTTVAAIGYGNIVPRTDISQFLLVCYSLFGIPLTLMFLANIGKLFADTVRFMFNRGLCHFYRKRRITNHLELHATNHDDPSKMPTIHENEAAELENLPMKRKKRKSIYHARRMSIEAQFIKEAVPKSFIFALLAVYTFVGTLLFSWSEDWTYTQSAYFNVITLMTIGLGDLVPGWSSYDTTMGQVKMSLGAIYIMIGLGVLFMGLNLIVDELMNASKKAALRVGLVDSAEKKKPRSNLERAVRRQTYF